MVNSILDPTLHDRLIKDIANYALDANIPQVFIQQSCANICTEDQLDWLKGFKGWTAEGQNGLILLGEGDPTMEMMGMAGALTRNFIRARFITMTSFLDNDNDPDLLEISCLFIANFFNHQAHSETIQNWKLPQVYDLLIRRSAKGKQTVVQVSNIEKMRIAYGAAIGNHLMATYPIIKIKGNS